MSVKEVLILIILHKRDICKKKKEGKHCLHSCIYCLLLLSLCKEQFTLSTASVTPLVVRQNSCTWANIINLNSCHAGTPACETTAALLVFKHECHCDEMDIAKTEDNLSGAYSESTDFIMEIGPQPNWHNEVNQ